MLVNLWRIYCNSARKCHPMGDLNCWMFTEIHIALPNHVCRQTDSCPPSWGLLKGMYPEWTSPQVTAEPHWCPGAWHLSCSSQLLQPCRRNPPPAPALARLSGLTPTLLVTAAADLDYLEKTGQKPYKDFPWHVKRKETSEPCRAGVRVFDGGLGRQQTLITDMVSWWPPFQNGCPAPPWRSLVWIYVKGRRGLETLRKHLFVCFLATY